MNDREQDTPKDSKPSSGCLWKGILAGVVLFVILILVGIRIPSIISYREKTHCIQAESDANAVASAIADYFSDPLHTDTPAFGDLNNGRGVTLSGANTATITSADPNVNITITVTDGSGKCRADYQAASPDWDCNGVYTLTITQEDYDWRRTAETQAKNIYNKAMAYFSETGATSITIDNLPDFESDPYVTITGGPMQFDGNNITFAVPMTLSYPYSSPIYVLRADGTVLTIEQYELHQHIDRFVANKNGIVWDKIMDLEWVAGPDKDTDWFEAKRWVEGLNVGGNGWRFPTRAELKTLYKKGAGLRNKTPLLKTTGSWVWSGETKCSSSAWDFGFGRGTEDCFSRDASINHRGFAVRSRR